MIGETPRPLAPSPVTVLQASAEDLDAVMEIMAAAFPPDFGEAWTRSQCAGILPMPGVALRLATDARGQLAGFALMRVVADEAELLLIAVKPRMQQQGIGRALIAFAQAPLERGLRGLGGRYRRASGHFAVAT